MRLFLAGHNGMVGKAVLRRLRKIANIDVIVRNRDELDLLDQKKVFSFLKNNKPDAIIIAAARVGGILANNTFPADFIFQNLQLQNNLIHGAHLADVQKIIFLGSSCIYPRNACIPIKENMLLSGKLEPTNEPYALAKIAGLKMCESYNRQFGRDYRTLMPTNLYGPNDNFDPSSSHVIPGLIRKIDEAKLNTQKEVSVWGTGEPSREFLHVDDMASASLFILSMEKQVYNNITFPDQSHINVGSGSDIRIRDLSEMIKKIVGFDGKITFDPSKPDGTQRKLLDVGLLRSMGWEYSVELKEGLANTYQWYTKNRNKLRSV